MHDSLEDLHYTTNSLQVTVDWGALSKPEARNRDRKMISIYPVYHLSEVAIDCPIYQLAVADTLTDYNEVMPKIKGKMEKHAIPQTKRHSFDPLDSMFSIIFPKKFKLACDTNGMDKDAACACLNVFKKKSALAALNANYSLENTRTTHTKNNWKVDINQHLPTGS